MGEVWWGWDRWGLVERQGVDAAGLAAAFDLVRAEHEAQPAESFNDDPTYKARLNQVYRARRQWCLRMNTCA